jgi:hypothetical protein
MVIKVVWHDQPQATVEAPLEHFMVSRWEQKAWSGKRRRRTDQRLEALVGLGDRVSKEGDVAGIAGDPTHLLDDPCGFRVDRLAQLTAAIEAMLPAAQQVTRRNVFLVAGLTSDPGNLRLSVPGITDSGSQIRSPSFVQR